MKPETRKRFDDIYARNEIMSLAKKGEFGSDLEKMTRKELVAYVIKNRITFPNRGPMANKPIPSNTMKNKAWLIDRIKTVNQKAQVEADQMNFEQGVLVNALNTAIHRRGSDDLLSLQRSGASNKQLKEFLGDIWGIQQGFDIDYFDENGKRVDGYVQLKGGKNPRMMFMFDGRSEGNTESSGKQVELKGAKLLQMMRKNAESEIEIPYDLSSGKLKKAVSVSRDRDNVRLWLAHDWVPDDTSPIFMFKDLSDKVQTKLIKTAMENTNNNLNGALRPTNFALNAWREDLLDDEISRYEVNGKLAIVSDKAYEEFYGSLIKMNPKEFKETATDSESLTDFSDLLGYMNGLYNKPGDDFWDQVIEDGPIYEGVKLGKGLREANDRARLRQTTADQERKLVELEKEISKDRLRKVRGISNPVKNDWVLDSNWVEYFTKNMPVDEVNEIREILLQNEELGSNVLWGNVDFRTNINNPMRTDKKTNISAYRGKNVVLDKSGELKDLYKYGFYDPVKDENKKASTAFSKSSFVFSRTYKDKHGRRRRYVSRNAGQGLIIWNDPTVARKIAKVGRSNGWLVRTIPVKGGFVNIANKPKIDEMDGWMDHKGLKGWGGNLTKGEGSGDPFEKKNSKPRGPYYRKKYPSCVEKASESSGLSKEVHMKSFRRGYGAAKTNPSSVRNKNTGKKRPGGWPKSQRMTPTQWGCARTKKLGRLKREANFDQDLI